MAERTTIVTEVAQVAEASGNDDGLVKHPTPARTAVTRIWRAPAVPGSVPAESRPSRSSGRGRQHHPRRRSGWASNPTRYGT